MKDLRASAIGVLGLGLGFAALSAGCHKAPAPVAVHYNAPTPVPTPTPVNDTVAFVREGAVWLEHSDGSAPRLLALPEREDDFWFPVVAPDGSGVLVWLSRSDGTQDLALVNADGDVTTITDMGQTARPGMKNLNLGNAPSFSPDGKRIVYGFNGNLWIVDADGFNQQTLIADGSSWSPAWSPDGKRIAYLNGTENHRDLWITDVDNRDNVQRTEFSGYNLGGPRWSPDGQNLLMTRMHGDNSDIVSVAATGDEPETTADNLLTRDHMSVSAAFSPSGSGLVFGSSQDGGNSWNLYTETLNGNNIRPITQDGGLSPDWSKIPLSTLGKAPSPTPSPTVTVTTKLSAPLPQAKPMAAKPSRPAPAVLPAKKPKKAKTKAKAKIAKTAPALARPLSDTAKVAKAPAPLPAKTATLPAVRQAAAAATTLTAQAKPSTLRLRFAASFDSQDHLDAQSEAGLKTLAHRARAYTGYTLDVIGPLDVSDLGGLYFSEDSRSQMRAQAAGQELAKLAGFPKDSVKGEPYSPPAGGEEPKTIIIYMELR